MVPAPIVQQTTVTLDSIFNSFVILLQTGFYYVGVFINYMSENSLYQQILGVILTSIPYLGLYTYAAFYINEQLLFCSIAYVDKGEQGEAADVETMTFVTRKNERQKTQYCIRQAYGKVDANNKVTEVSEWSQRVDETVVPLLETFYVPEGAIRVAREYTVKFGYDVCMFSQSYNFSFDDLCSMKFILEAMIFLWGE